MNTGMIIAIVIAIILPILVAFYITQKKNNKKK
jgi:uncharacterized protein YneF (UPF0154 family)